MKLILNFACFALIFSFIASAKADDSFHPTRSQLLFHANHKLSDSLQLRGHFIPSANLSKQLPPIAYLGLGALPSDWLDIEPALGWSFAGAEPIFSFMTAPSHGIIWSWTDLELNLPSRDAYYFAQAELRFHPALSLGAETEGWGALNQDSSWSHGGGPNAIIHFRKKASLDLALHIRNLDGNIKPQGFIRFQLFFME